MALSVTQKLTVIVAVLSFLALAPAAAVLYVLMQRGVETEGIERADATIHAVSDAILAQLDEDLFVEASPGRTRLDELRTSYGHWLVMRGGGERLAARGVLEGSGPAVLGAPTQTMRFPGRGAFAVASAPLVYKEPLRRDDLPVAVQTQVMTHATGGAFVRARQVPLRDRTLYDVKLLFADRLVSVEVSGDGELIETEQKELPDRLPTWVEVTGPSGEIIRESRIVGWRAYEGELIALVEGHTGAPEPVQLAVNRLGETYVLDRNGEIVQMREESRLWLVVAYDMGPELAGLRSFGRATALGGVLAWLLMIAVAWQVTKRALRPVDEIVRRTGQIDAPHLSERLPVGPADDELSRVARTVNKMLDRIQESYLREQQFTGDASHEMRNPLAKMIAEIDLARSRHREKEQYEATLDHLKGYACGMQHLVESLLVLARLDGGAQGLQKEPFDVADLAMEILKTFPRDSAQRVRLELGDSAGPMQAVGHRDLIRVLLRNLVDNALRYSPPESPVRLRVSPNATEIDVEVQDEGPGIPPEQIALVFNRFYRLEKSRSRQTGGAGLGLSIVKAIADVHDMKVTLSAEAGRGTRALFALAAFNGRAQGTP